MFNHQRLKCYVMSLGLAKMMPRLISSWPRGYYYLVDQLKRAMASVILNTAEGNGRMNSKERKRFFEIARASAAEVSSIIDVAEALNLIQKPMAEYIQDQLTQIAKMLYRLP